MVEGNNILMKKTYLDLNKNSMEGPFYWDVILPKQ